VERVKAPWVGANPYLRLAAMIACTILGLSPGIGRSQITPQQANQLRTALGTRIEALTILGGDFGLSDGSYRSKGPSVIAGSRPQTDIDVTKIGGAGDVGDPQPLGNLGIGWQPRLQGNMGYLDSKNTLRAPPLAGDVSRFRDFAIQFGGGVRLWVSDALSFAPTFMGMYGHTTNEYTANSAFMRANLGAAKQMGLLDWAVNTWSIRSSLDIQYLIRLDRVLVTLSSDPTYYYTESFRDSDVGVKVSGDSGSLANKIDVDIPLGMQLYGHELRTGGYLSRTELYGDLKTGLDVQHINELHGRLVLDFLNQYWKVQWIGLGASYLWGTNIAGWTVGADVTFKF
jgi:hypothetical protein